MARSKNKDGFAADSAENEDSNVKNGMLWLLRRDRFPEKSYDPQS